MISYELYGPRDLRLEDVPVPEVGPTDVKVRIAHNGICGSDLHFYFAEPRTGWSRPRHIGHESSGVVTEIGAEVGDVAVGDRVVIYPIDSCGECQQCTDDYPVLCTVFDRKVSTIGCGSPVGTLAEFAVVPSRLIIPLPEPLSLAQGALVEPLAVSATAVLRAELAPHAKSVVLGGGPIGIGVVLALQAAGSGDFVVVEPSPSRREALQKLTPARVLDPTSEDVAGYVSGWTDGIGADVIFECAGVQASLDSALTTVKNRGKVILIGLFESAYTMVPNPWALREITIQGHNGSTKHGFRTVMQWMVEGRIPTDSWVNHVPYENAVEDGFDRLRTGELLKVLVDLPPA